MSVRPHEIKTNEYQVPMLSLSMDMLTVRMRYFREARFDFFKVRMSTDEPHKGPTLSPQRTVAQGAF